MTKHNLNRINKLKEELIFIKADCSGLPNFVNFRAEQIEKELKKKRVFELTKIPPAENMADKRARKKQKVLSWLKIGETGGGSFTASGKVKSTRPIKKKIPIETPCYGRDSKISEYSKGVN